jgi:hypothetical protein
MFIIRTILVTSQLVIAAADGVPKIDAKKTCRNAATVTGTVTQQDVEACIADEQGAHDELIKTWGQFSATSKAQCIHVSTDYLPSYVEVLTCLSLARDAKNIPEEKARSSNKRRLSH